MNLVTSRLFERSLIIVSTILKKNLQLSIGNNLSVNHLSHEAGRRTAAEYKFQHELIATKLFHGMFTE